MSYPSGEYWYYIDLNKFEEDIRKDEQCKLIHSRRLEAITKAEKEKVERERNQYFLKQKLIGLFSILFSVLCFTIIDNIIIGIILLSIGVSLLFTNKMLWCNKYWLNITMKNL